MSADQSEKVEESEPISLREDLMVLTKIRLNTFVLITTLFGFLLASLSLHGTLVSDWGLLLHTLLGTGAAAFGSAAFNQLMEIEQDRMMRRTANRPLPARRMNVTTAFMIGWGLSAFGVIHLGALVNTWAAYLAAVTIAIYVFVYTPLKRKSTTNTLIGAIPGAIPPVIGWAAAGGNWNDWEAWYLFALLFLWQMPHFVAINWLCREEYEEAGYVMWSNGDVSGEKTARIALMFSICLTALAPIAYVAGFAGIVYTVGGTLAGAYMCWLAVEFGKKGDRPSARKLFLFTLLYLPLALGLLAFSWH
eukprot:Seg19662.1 transcript_id=Seg19662.1/GoldUCD/mRNA.D3Y31 product="Protoheme IX farnesyltransferase" protein_id=Seg19662.1/GoldUCD/D3Y31